MGSLAEDLLDKGANSVTLVSESGLYKIVLKSNLNSIKVSFPNRGMKFVSAPALYKAVLRSDKKEATQFQDWVTFTVLPAIRNDGMFVLGEEKVATGEMTIEEMEVRNHGSHTEGCPEPPHSN